MRKRAIYALMTLIVMSLGLASRKWGMYLPDFISIYSGDTLWAMMVYFGLRFLWPDAKRKYTAIGACFFSFEIECSQLYL